ncbi:MAG: PP2C family protein-serine/threonine phosphatase [bacterium]|nr:PP2C family protein-serine/threonine phosphatase [bacterium]
MNPLQKLSRFQWFALLILGIVIFDFIQGLIIIITEKKWGALIPKFITLAVLALIVFFYRKTIKEGWEAIKKRREASREQFEKSGGDIDIKEAALFSLSWSREIYNGIPTDRKSLVKSSFILIGIALVIMLIQMESYSLLAMAVIIGLILAGVNLLIWVVGSEREAKDRIGIELEAARRMQLSLMPDKAPSIENLDIAGRCIPARDVGGDLFDFVWTGKAHDKLCVTVVDVSGKGMDAALTAVYTSGALVSEAQHQEDLVTVVKNMNSAVFSRQNRSRFVSMLMMNLNIADNNMEYVNAGQSRPMLLRDNNVSILKTPGARFPLGVVTEPDYKSAQLMLKPGDSLLLYTDGVSEAMNDEQEMLGDERLIDIFKAVARDHDNAVDQVEAMRREIEYFAGEAQQHDDITIVIINALAHEVPCLTA